MFIKKNDFNYLENEIAKLNKLLVDSNFEQIAYIIGNKKQILVRNIIAGISRGIGTGIGFTLITAIIVIILQKIVKLNLPIIGDYVIDIIDIVKNRR